MTDDDYLRALGKLLANLHALETSLRAFLINRPEAGPVHETHGVDLRRCQLGPSCLSPTSRRMPISAR